jgi:hypothetical protein
MPQREPWQNQPTDLISASWSRPRSHASSPKPGNFPFIFWFHHNWLFTYTAYYHRKPTTAHYGLTQLNSSASSSAPQIFMSFMPGLTTKSGVHHRNTWSNPTAYPTSSTHSPWMDATTAVPPWANPSRFLLRRTPLRGWAASCASAPLQRQSGKWRF